MDSLQENEPEISAELKAARYSHELSKAKLSQAETELYLTQQANKRLEEQLQSIQVLLNIQSPDLMQLRQTIKELDVIRLGIFPTALELDIAAKSGSISDTLLDQKVAMVKPYVAMMTPNQWLIMCETIPRLLSFIMHLRKQNNVHQIKVDKDKLAIAGSKEKSFKKLPKVGGKNAKERLADLLHARGKTLEEIQEWMSNIDMEKAKLVLKMVKLHMSLETAKSSVDAIG